MFLKILKIAIYFFDFIKFSDYWMHDPVVGVGVFSCVFAFKIIEIFVFAEYRFNVHSVLNKDLNANRKDQQMMNFKFLHRNMHKPRNVLVQFQHKNLSFHS